MIQISNDDESYIILPPSPSPLPHPLLFSDFSHLLGFHRPPQVVNLMKNLSRSIPTSAWLTALPQLISRICHPAPDVQGAVQGILVRVTEAFPQQVNQTISLWKKGDGEKRRQPAGSRAICQPL